MFTTELSAVAVVKAGAACTKAGSTSTVSNKKFTCVKAGKKLVWDKGVVVKKPVVIIPETPKIETSPVPTATPIAKLISDGDVCKKPGEILTQGNTTYKCLIT